MQTGQALPDSSAVAATGGLARFGREDSDMESHTTAPADVLAEVRLEEIQERIRVIESLDLADVPMDMLVEQVQALCQGYATITRRISMRAAYRARKSALLFPNVRELWYPPARVLTSIGRCNAAYEPVFYCSDSEGTAILETRPTVGDKVTVLQAIPRSPIRQPRVFEVGLPEHVSPNNPKIPAGQLHDDDEAVKVVGGKDNLAKLRTVRAFLVREFTRIVEPGNEHEYKTSLAITRFHADDSIDGLWYPSIASNRLGTNLALRTGAADDLLRPFACWQIEVVERLADSEFRVLCTKKAKRIEIDGSILW